MCSDDVRTLPKMSENWRKLLKISEDVMTISESYRSFAKIKNDRKYNPERLSGVWTRFGEFDRF